jgi:hypothetical protein
VGKSRFLRLNSSCLTKIGLPNQDGKMRNAKQGCSVSNIIAEQTRVEKINLVWLEFRNWWCGWSSEIGDEVRSRKLPKAKNISRYSKCRTPRDEHHNITKSYLPNEITDPHQIFSSFIQDNITAKSEMALKSVRV